MIQKKEIVHACDKPMLLKQGLESQSPRSMLKCGDLSYSWELGYVGPGCTRTICWWKKLSVWSLITLKFEKHWSKVVSDHGPFIKYWNQKLKTRHRQCNGWTKGFICIIQGEGWGKFVLWPLFFPPFVKKNEVRIKIETSGGDSKTRDQNGLYTLT